MNGVVVGLGIALFCALLGVPMIVRRRRSNEPWIDLKSEFGLFPLAMVVCAALGLVIALVSALFLLF